MGRQGADISSSTAEIARLDSISNRLLNASLADSSKKQYQRAWNFFEQFCKELGFKTEFPIEQKIILRFISYMFDLHYAYSSICSMVSCINYFQRMANLPSLQTLIVQKTLLGVKNLSPASKGCLPISKQQLNEVIRKSEWVLSDHFTTVLFKAMASLAFYALLRVGEFTYSPHTLKLSDVFMSSTSITIKFKTFKHSKGEEVVQTIPALKLAEFCPVQLLHKYLQIRGGKEGFLFLKPDGFAPSRKEFLHWLQCVLIALGWQVQDFNTHAFRAGMATHMAMSGASAEQIKIAGRWSSDAYKKYIRVNTY